MSNFYDNEEMYDEGELATKKCDFCGQVVDWTEPVADIDENGNNIELRSCLMCSFEGVFSREEIQTVMDQMKKNK
ncbi:hypothetical protein Back11_57630 [Paenibacillus baekrokdamisoli]|uniref:Uncharacterized protein n=1 Tax=Paenibacillus baekrokdamisoli TaxID=1712516 RepID=A0A3G9JJY9_9BACL|nr:hypothetical protein [Paenibacillus baekrokdamisoli]MBB3072860.1 Zn ribbon nucleic-acid-binding protein [Paenibacillus baekrokdamisoli]BBH24418.1 hypothetical protein Back11_57630 [Paenibacillus baekrokdamisoli]